MRTQDLKKEATYKDILTYKYGTLTFKGKSKEINFGYNSFEKCYLFTYTDEFLPKEMNNSDKWIRETHIKNLIKQ